MTLSFGPLTKRHDRATFSSGSPTLDRWFRTQASQDEKRGVSRVVVATDADGIAGFYTLSMFSVALDSVPPAVARRLPRYGDVPAALIGRLARAQRLAGTGVGELLVFNAFERISAATNSVAAFFIVVDAKDNRAATFYRRLGFVPF
ncbi:MAG: family acetyltransferase, partial [Myxococcales bacterium]|nr:family acetyltransferase [Myxococcales bacterium]